MIHFICSSAIVIAVRGRSLAKSVIEMIAIRSFYVGFRELDSTTALQRRLELTKKYNAETFESANGQGDKIDALYIASQSALKTGNVFVLCLNTTYQDHHPSRWEPFLQSGADVLLWNPTKLGPVSYSKDLSAILNSLRQKKRDQQIAVKTYCASSDPAIRAVADQEDPKMHLIIDRGYGDVCQLARSFTILAALPLVRSVLKETFDCQGVDKIQKVRGKILFLTPNQGDQVMDYKAHKNLTRDLHAKRSDQPLIKLDSSDHWSDWGSTTYNDVLKFLAELNVVNKNYNRLEIGQFPNPVLPSWFKQECVPILIKTPC